MALTPFQPSTTSSKPAAPWRNVYTVSRLNQEVRGLMEASFPPTWVQGEISNLARPASGHIYFSLKDNKCQVRCAMFRSATYRSQVKPENGMQVLIKARVGLYEARGEYQLVAEEMEDAGAGELQRAFEQLKAKLQAEGLFDKGLKQPLPALPQRIGVVTSPTGAAIKDILSVLRRRFPAASVVIYPSMVQGDAAVAEVCRAIETANQRNECDVLIVARGGGSLEDLQAFNDEAVARAIHASSLPVVSGVGHEVDTSIADFVADLRAATPSAAAEAVVPDKQDWLERLQNREQRLQRGAAQQLRRQQTESMNLSSRLARLHPARQLQDQQQRVDELSMRLQRVWQSHFEQAKGRLQLQQRGLQAQQPDAQLRQLADKQQQLAAALQRVWQQQLQLRQNQLAPLQQRLLQNPEQHLQRSQQRLAQAAACLQAISPLATVARGYALAHDEQGKLLRDAAAAPVGSQVQLRLAQGELQCRVENQLLASQQE